MNVYVESNFVLELALLQEQSASGEAINYKDFGDPHIVEQLDGHNCKFFPRFDSGHQFILNALR